MKPKAAILFAVAVAVAGCMTAYQPMGLTGGYEDRRISPASYFIRTRVNSHSSRGLALEYFHRRAAEICRWEGFDGYAVVDRDISSKSYIGVDDVERTNHEYSGVIACRGKRHSPPSMEHP